MLKELEPWVGEGEHEIGGLESEKSSVSSFKTPSFLLIMPCHCKENKKM